MSRSWLGDKMSSRMTSNRGQTFLDYLFIILIVTTIGIPILVNIFGGSVRRGLFENRQKLVDFLSQTPKRPVPNVWFAVERAADPPNPNVPPTGPGDEPGVGGPDPNVPEPGKIPEPNVPAPGEIPEPRIADLGRDRGGSGPSAGGAGGGGPGGRGSGPGGDDVLSDNFFGGKGGGLGEDEDGKGGTGRSTGVGASIRGDETPSTGLGGKADLGKKGDKKAEDEAKSQSDTQSRKYQNEQLQRIAEEERAKGRAIDWWMVIKILIILAIFFLVMLIVLGNLRKR